MGRVWHYIENCLLDNEGLASRSSTRKLVKKIAELQPDIVHLHNIHDHWLNYEILFEYLNQTDIKVVWTFHDFWAITGHCSHFVQMDCDRFKTECHGCPYTKGKFLPRNKNFYKRALQAKKMKMGRETFVRKFSSQFGVSPKLFFHRLRAAAAAKELLNADLTIREVAARFNFSSEFYFSRFMKKMTGLSPREYRKRMAFPRN